MKPYKYSILLLFIMLFASSCSKFLDSKPSANAVIISELDHLQLLLNSESHFNTSRQNMLLEIYSDDHLMERPLYDELVDFDKAMYKFDPIYIYEQPQINATWSNPNGPIQISNTILGLLPKMKGENPALASQIEGATYYYRGSTWWYQAQVYAPVYVRDGDNNKHSIPLRKSADLNEKSVRSTVQETYDAILDDLQKSLRLLPLTTQYRTQPDKATAYGFLARVYLSMQEYDKAGRYADSALQLRSTLMDFNNLDSTVNLPIEKFNEETIFYSTTFGNNTYHQGRGGYINPELYNQYESDDLRRVMFFAERAGHQRFKGSYAGSVSTMMAGVCVDEMYLIRAESFARAGQVQHAMDDLNTLLVTRWRKDTFKPYSATNVAEALRIVLSERRKSLVMRRLRFTDLRRLNLEPDFAKTIVRTFGEGSDQEVFTLPPNDKRYVFLFPQIVIDITGMPQTER